MQVQQIVEEIDQEIARLQQARALLADEPARRGRPRGPGRPRKEASAAPKEKRSGTRTMSPEGRKRIAEAMRKRWADRKKNQQ